MKNAIATIIRGFLLGLGFTIAAAGVMFAVQAYWTKQIQSGGASALYGDFDAAAEQARKDIVLSDAEEQTHDGQVAILGKLKNTGTRPARGLQVEADLFLKDKFVDQYSTYVSGTVKPGETRYFKIGCGCKDSPPAKHDSFKVHVHGGF